MGNSSTNVFTDKLIGRMFRRAEGIVWCIQTGKVGISTTDGIATLSGAGEDAVVEVNMMDQFGIEVPAYAQSTPIADVKVGDLIYFGAKEDKPGWVVARNEKKIGDTDRNAITFKLMRTTGTISTWTPPKVQMLGMGDNGVMVLRSLTNMLPNGQSGLGDMQNSLTMMMQMQMMTGGDTDIDFDKIMPMMLMGQMTGQGGGNMMQTMLMMQMMSGGSSPFGGSKSPFRKG